MPTNFSYSLLPKSSMAKRGNITVSRGSAKEENIPLINAMACPNGVFEIRISPIIEINAQKKQIFIEIRMPNLSYMSPVENFETVSKMLLTLEIVAT